MNLAETNLAKICQLLQVYDTGYSLVRVGRERDGGYLTVNELNYKTDMIVSCGVDDDVSFELDFVNRYSQVGKVLLYDPSIDALPETHPKFEFHKTKVNPIEVDGITLSSIIRMEQSDNILLKMDIEWDEWASLYWGTPETLNKFSQIVCEFHFVPFEFRRAGETDFFAKFFDNIYQRMTRSTFDYYADVLESLAVTHTVAHVHGNNSLGFLERDGLKLPMLLEVTMVRTDLCPNKTPYYGVLPRTCDYPNKPYKPELEGYYPWKITG